LRRLDLDDFGAHIAQYLRGAGACNGGAQVKNSGRIGRSLSTSRHADREVERLVHRRVVKDPDAG